MTNSVQISKVIHASKSQVWDALTIPEIIKTYFFDSTVETDWKPGSPITWSGEYKGKPYKDKGTIEAVEVNNHLSMTHWSPLSGLPDKPENYHTVTFDLEGTPRTTKVTLTQTNLTGTTPEQAKKNWEPVLEGIKTAVGG
ncbi:MAG: SRPBCC domain-containing protein [Paracoccaceae bacterium]